MTTTTISKAPVTVADLNRPPTAVLRPSDLDDDHQLLRDDLAWVLGINVHSLPRAFGGSAGKPSEGGTIREGGKARPWYWGAEVKRWASSRPRIHNKKR